MFFFINQNGVIEIHGKKTPALWVALMRILLIWRLKVKRESTCIPRSVTEDELVSWDPFMKYGWGIIDLEFCHGEWIRHYMCLYWCLVALQDLAHDERRSRDCLRSPQLKTSTLKDKYSLTSSANKLSLAWPIQVIHQYIIWNIKNKTGPRVRGAIISY